MLHCLRHGWVSKSVVEMEVMSPRTPNGVRGRCISYCAIFSGSAQCDIFGIVLETWVILFAQVKHGRSFVKRSNRGRGRGRGRRGRGHGKKENPLLSFRDF